MSDSFPYKERAEATRAAYVDEDLVFEKVGDGWDSELLAAMKKEARDRYVAAKLSTFPGGFYKAWDDIRTGNLPLAPLLDFLEADPYFSESGHFKSRAARRLKRVPLDEVQAERLRCTILSVIEQGRGSYELTDYFRLARRIKNDWLVERIRELTLSTDGKVAWRARRAFIILTDQLQRPERSREYPWRQPDVARREQGY